MVPAVIIVAIILITAGGSGNAPSQRRLPPPAKLPPLPKTFTNAGIGLTGKLPGDWTAIRRPGFVQLASKPGNATIAVLARPLHPKGKTPLLKPAVDAIRAQYKSVTVKHALGTRLGGLPARSVVLYTRNKHAPEEPGRHPVLPPRRWGGNMDIKHLQPGTTLYLPVGVEGALFSLGDTHAAMGDAEVCGTAVETAMEVTLRLTVRRDLNLHYPQYHVPAGQLARAEASSYHVCTGIADDLLEAAREATRALVDHIVARYELPREEAYAIASVAADLRIHEVVDVPNWVVGAFLPEAIFGSADSG